MSRARKLSPSVSVRAYQQWPPLPKGPPPPPQTFAIEHLSRPWSAFPKPTLAPLQLYYDRPLSPQATRIEPGSPWARGTEKAWQLDESAPVVKEVVDWHNFNKAPSPQTQSTVGTDPFLYHLRGFVYPAAHRLEELRERLYLLATETPEQLHLAVHYEQLGTLLGQPEFEWVQLPRTKTNGESSTGEPW